MIHRDIKPANIIVTRDPDTNEIDRVAVLDFGIAKLANGTDLTATNSLVRSLAYLAPEIINAQPARRSSDEYAFTLAVERNSHATRRSTPLTYGRTCSRTRRSEAEPSIGTMITASATSAA